MSEQTELYRHYDQSGRLLYVGISKHSLARLAAHRAGARWYELVVRVEIERFPTREAALAEEARAIERETPLWNKQRPAARMPAPERPPEAHDHPTLSGFLWSRAVSEAEKLPLNELMDWLRGWSPKIESTETYYKWRRQGWPGANLTEPPLDM